MITLFENATQRNVFCIYIFSWVVYGQLVTFAKGENGIDYSPALLVIMAEFIKTCVCLFIYTREKTLDALLANVLNEKKLFLLCKFHDKSSVRFSLRICLFRRLDSSRHVRLI